MPYPHTSREESPRSVPLRIPCVMDPAFLWVAAALWLAPFGVSKAQSFTNVAAAQGLDIQVQSDIFGSGVSSYDFDEDGWDDLSFAMSNDSLAFYRNNAGQLERLPSFLYAPGETKHVLWVDYDNDGDLDLTVTTRSGSYRLYANDGAFHFTDVSVQAGFAQTVEESYGAAWADYDRDGDLDMYMCTYAHLGDESNYPGLNHLYQNNGDGTFTDVTLAAGVGDSIRLSFQAVWLDYDMDGWQDLYVINDRFYRSSMYHNNGDGTFSDVTLETGTGATFDDPMSASVADFDNDGDLDIYTSNGGADNLRGRLFVNNGDGTFSEEAGPYGVDIYLFSWAAVWVDVDNDTWQDLYVATRGLLDTIEDNVFYKSMAGNSFLESPGTFIGDHNAPSFGVARADLDNDGYYDIAVQNQLTYVPFLWHNSGGSNHFIKVTLQGTISNRMAIGSWIRVYAGGNQYTQYTLCGENYLGQNSQHHIFGLAQYTVVDSVQVEYVSGHIDTYYQLEVDQSYSFTEGETYHVEITASGETTFCGGGSVVLDAGEHAHYLWSDGSSDRYLTVFASGSYSVEVVSAGGFTAHSDTVIVAVLPAPQVETITENPLCADGSTGSIELVNLTGVPAQQVLWNTSDEGVLLSDLPAGIYSYVFTDTNGCVASGEQELVEPPELLVLATANPMVLGNDGSIEVQIFGGVPPYTITLDGLTAGLLTTDLAAGSYALVVYDDNGCLYAETVVVDDANGITTVGDPAFRLFPVPVEDRLTFITTATVRSARIYDHVGRTVWSATGTSRSIDVSALAAGQYVLSLILLDGSAVRAPFIKIDSRD